MSKDLPTLLVHFPSDICLAACFGLFPWAYKAILLNPCSCLPSLQGSYPKIRNASLNASTVSSQGQVGGQDIPMGQTTRSLLPIAQPIQLYSGVSGLQTRNVDFFKRGKHVTNLRVLIWVIFPSPVKPSLPHRLYVTSNILSNGIFASYEFESPKP